MSQRSKVLPRLGWCAVVLCALATRYARGGDGEEFVVIKAGRVITVSGEEFAPGTIVIEDGKISAVGGDIEYPPSARVIGAQGQTVMPGLIHPRSRFGLAKYSRSGVHGDQSAASEVYPLRMRFDDLVEAGYTAVCFIPNGTGIPGVAAAYRTAGPDEARSLSENAYLQVVPNWRGGGKKNLRDALKKAKEEIEKVEKARKEWEEKQKEKAEKDEEGAEEEGDGPEEGEDEDEDEGGDSLRAHRSRADDDGDGDDDDGDDKPEPENGDKKEKEPEKFEPPKIDPKYQPLVDLIEEKEGARMMVAVKRASDLLHLDDVLKQYEGLAHVLYLATARESDYSYVVDRLGEQKASVVLRPWIHFLPQTTFRYNLMERLDRAGCAVSAVPWNESRGEYLAIRKRVAELVRAGLSREAALKSLTLHPAEAVGLGKRLGSIEKEKDADLVFFDGDPLDPHSSVVRMMILGEIVWEADRKGSGGTR